jgi:DNA replication protein DnaC
MLSTTQPDPLRLEVRDIPYKYKRTVSLLDRLVHHSIVVVTDGESFRMREARKRTRPGGSSK